MTVRHRERTLRSAITRVLNAINIIEDFAVVHPDKIKSKTIAAATELEGNLPATLTAITAIASIPPSD